MNKRIWMVLIAVASLAGSGCNKGGGAANCEKVVDSFAKVSEVELSKEERADNLAVCEKHLDDKARSCIAKASTKEALAKCEEALATDEAKSLGKMLAMFVSAADQMCACKDEACYKDLEKKFQARMTPDKIDEMMKDKELTEKIGKLGDRVKECRDKMTSGGDKATSGDDKPAGDGDQPAAGASSSGADVLAKMRPLVDKMCACADKACLDKVEEEAKTIISEKDLETLMKDASAADEFAKLGERGNECRKKVLDAEKK
jgi:hypothetical protein